MGELPDWYSLIQIAKYVSVPPWELIEQPQLWRDLIAVAMTGEARGQRMRLQMMRH